jgi:hypothetical protein
MGQSFPRSTFEQEPWFVKDSRHFAMMMKSFHHPGDFGYADGYFA